MSDGSKQWDGVRDDTSDVGDGLSVMQGVSFAVEGELRRRPGLTALAAYGGPLTLAFRTTASGAWAVIVTSGGAIESVQL